MASDSFSQFHNPDDGRRRDDRRPAEPSSPERNHSTSRPGSDTQEPPTHAPPGGGPAARTAPGSRAPGDHHSLPAGWQADDQPTVSLDFVPDASGTAAVIRVPGPLDAASTVRPAMDSQGGSTARDTGRYQLLEVVGKGGFAEVWRGFDSLLQRTVAVKVPRSDRPLSAPLQQQFLREAQRVARLHLQGVVPVHDVGQGQGGVYIVSEYIEGGTLAEHLRRQWPMAREAARLVAEVAQTLHQAHGQGIVHRDIKPSNILLDGQGRTWVADFGLAVSQDEQLEESAAALGTVAYMSPEQARGESHRVDARSDIYSLGVVLYQLLTGRLPFTTRSFSEYRDQVQRLEPPAPGTLVGAVPEELDRICMKCLARPVSDRYATAADLGRQLQQWLAGTEVRRPAGRLRGAMGWLAVAGCLLLVGGLLAAGGWPQPWRGDGSSGTSPPEPRVLLPEVDRPLAHARGGGVGDPAPPPETQPWWQGVGRAPQELIWPGYRGKASLGFRDDSQAYVMTSDAARLVSLGELDDRPWNLSVGVDTRMWWNGTVGLFLGYRLEQHRYAIGQQQYVEEPAATFQMITLFPIRDEQGQHCMRFRRFRAVIEPRTGQLVAQKELSYQHVPWPEQAGQFQARLEVERDETGLHSIRWAGRELDQLMGPWIEDRLIAEDYHGPWGLFIRYGTVWFFDPMIRYQESQ